MKKVLLLLAVLLTATNIFGQEESVTFDFSSKEQLEAWGIAIPANGAGTSVNGLLLTSGDVTFQASDNTATTTTRIFAAADNASNPGALNLRVYNGASFVINVPEGNIIKNIVVTTSSATNLVKTTNTWSDGSFNAETLTYTPAADVASVTFTSANTCQFNTIVVNYGKAAETVDPSVTFDFTKADEATGKIYGYDVPEASSGIVLTGDVSIAPVTITPFNAEGATESTSVRLYTSKGEATDLRIYTGDGLVYKVNGDYHITKIAIMTANSAGIDAYTVNVGSISGGIWTSADSNVSEVIYTATGTARINTVTVYYAEGGATTGISDVGVSHTDNGAMYNLAGQRVDSAHKGIYIKNGKKFIAR